MSRKMRKGAKKNKKNDGKEPAEESKGAEARRGKRSSRAAGSKTRGTGEAGAKVTAVEAPEAEAPKQEAPKQETPKQETPEIPGDRPGVAKRASKNGRATSEAPEKKTPEADGAPAADSGTPGSEPAKFEKPRKKGKVSASRPDDLMRIVEALLFSSREPLSVERLVKVLGRVGKARVREAIEQINREYEEADRPFRLIEAAGGYQVMTNPEFAPWLARLISSKGEERLTRSALETLAIIAYKQPITRAEIEAIRGVHAGQALKVLLEKNLVKIAGRAEILGRPMLYATTRLFLDHFGLKSVKDLPKRSELLAG